MITVLGSAGFIGSHLAMRVRSSGLQYFAPERGLDLRGRELDHVIYCIGLTADFRSRLLETVDAHVCELLNVIQNCSYSSFLYLSSTRLYGRDGTNTDEQAAIQLNPQDVDHFYNASKVMGESITLNCGGPAARVARLSTVYGGDFKSENFLSAVLREAIRDRAVLVRTSPDSERDFVSVDDVVDILLRIATSGQHRIYNVASGTNVSNRDLLAKISILTGSRITFQDNAPLSRSTRIATDRIRTEFNFEAKNVLDEIPYLVRLYSSRL